MILHIYIISQRTLNDCLDEESRLRCPHDILSLGSNIIDITDSRYVHIAHLSVLVSNNLNKNKVLSNFVLDKKVGNQVLATNCLAYLSFRGLKTGPTADYESYASRLAQYPLPKYCETARPYHAKASGMRPELIEKILQKFSPQSRGALMSWVQVLNADFNFKWDFYPKNATVLYYAASFGLNEIVYKLIESDVDLDAPESRFSGTALHGATLRHHIRVMRALFQADADARKADFKKVSPLHTAVTHDGVEVIRLLLEYGASRDTVDGMGVTPYDWAVNAGQCSVYWKRTRQIWMKAN